MTGGCPGHTSFYMRRSEGRALGTVDHSHGSRVLQLTLEHTEPVQSVPPLLWNQKHKDFGTALRRHTLAIAHLELRLYRQTGNEQILKLKQRTAFLSPTWEAQR